ncbi:MAG: LytTR family DNA-binding domain-containing protein [Eubacteriales bacterium]|nr:LytTR family DNA-binding domain-containing protein [Eubacteriales bacterium]
MKGNMFCIAVCDDEPSDREEIVKMTKEICHLEHIESEISCFSDPEELLRAIEKGKCYDLLLMDVIMPRQTGVEIVRDLRAKKQEVSIVFISSNREMALMGYEVSAARYLAKPLEREKLREAITFCYGQSCNQEELLIPINGGVKKVSSREICYIEIKGRKSRIVQEKEKCDTSLSIDKLEKMLAGKGFIRCHQSFLVNCSYIRTLRTSLIELTDGTEIPVSKHRVKEVRRLFFDYMEQ